MTNAKVRLHLAIDERLKKRLEELAEIEHRSTCAQVEHLLELGVRQLLNEREKEGLAK